MFIRSSSTLLHHRRRRFSSLWPQQLQHALTSATAKSPAMRSPRHMLDHIINTTNAFKDSSPASSALKYFAAALFAVTFPWLCAASSENSAGDLNPDPNRVGSDVKGSPGPINSRDRGVYFDIIPQTKLNSPLDPSSTSSPTQSDARKKDHYFAEALKAFKAALRSDQIETDETTLIERGKTENSYHSIDGAYPNIILYPESTSDVSTIMKICFENNIPVVPFGGGTSLEGQILCLDRGVSLDMNNMKKIVKLNEQDMDVVVQAGLGYVELNELLYPKGLWFPLDPGPGASIGGMVSTRCSGSTAVKYGSMRENVLSLTLVTSDGSVVVTGGRARKSSAGYDLTRLMVGSEGTLGIVTEATIKVRKLSHNLGALRVSFRNGIKDAGKAARDIINNNEGIVNRCEFMDDAMIATIKMTEPSLDLPTLDTLLVEVEGFNQTDLGNKIAIVKEIAIQNGGSDVSVTTDPIVSKELWKVRKVALWSALAAYPDKHMMITDICVPLSNLPTIIEAVKERSKSSILACPMVAHAGDGNIHVFIMFDPDNETEHAEADRLSNFMVETALSLEGTCTGEHGIGYGKMKYMKMEFNDATVKMMADIKVSLDPKNLLNPGKVIDPKYIKASQENNHKMCKSCNSSKNKYICG